MSVEDQRIACMKLIRKDESEPVSFLRQQLRSAVFCTLLHASAQKIEGSDTREDVMRQKAAGFVEFGSMSGLFPHE